jgi:hypothetical protein
MVPISNQNSERCSFRRGDRCTNDKIADGIIVNDSIQSQWYCANCEYFKNRASLS